MTTRGKSFMQCHTLHKHKKYHCPNLETEQAPKEECTNCSKRLHSVVIQKRVPKSKRVTGLKPKLTFDLYLYKKMSHGRKDPHFHL